MRRGAPCPQSGRGANAYLIFLSSRSRFGVFTLLQARQSAMLEQCPVGEGAKGLALKKVLYTRPITG